MTDERLMTAEEIAERLAVPTSWVREHTRSGTIPHVPLGRYVRYELAEVLAWVESCKRPGRLVAFRKARVESVR